MIIGIGPLRFAALLTQQHRRHRTGCFIGITALALFLCCAVACPGGSGTDENAQTAKIEALGGKVKRGAQDRVERIYLQETSPDLALTDGDIESVDFAAFSDVESLLLNAESVTDRSLVHLSKLDKLRVFYLANSKVTDKGMKAFLCKQPTLMSVSLVGTPISDASMATIGDLNELAILSLSGSNISDKGLSEVVRLRKLVFLNLSKTKITDKGLVHLSKLTSLRIVHLHETMVTDVGIQSLKAQNPRLKIVQ